MALAQRHLMAVLFEPIYNSYYSYRMNIPTNRSMSLDLLRSLSILYIVGFWHMLDYTNVSLHYSKDISFRVTLIVLAVFTFLAGYFTGKNQVEFDRASLKLFFQKRLIRIYPLFLVALVIFFVTGGCDAITFLKSVVALSTFWGPAPGTLWFVIMLLFFSMMSPWLMSLAKKKNQTPVWVAYVLMAAALVILNDLILNVDIRIVTYFSAFYLGIRTAVRKNEPIKKTTGVILLVAGTAISFGIQTGNAQHDFAIASLMVAMASYYIFMLFDLHIRPSIKIHRIISILSYASYCMYLFHRPLYGLLKKLYFPQMHVLQILYLLAFCLPVIILVSYFVQKIYDDMVRRLQNRKSN